MRAAVGGSRARRLRIASAVFTTGLAVAAAAPSVYATFPGGNGRIAFGAIEYSDESNDDTREIVSIRPDGSSPRLLAGNSAEHPAYRPDGHMIAFVRPGGIFLMRSDGSAKRRLFSGPYGDPDWAPDGRRLVVTRTRTPRGIVIWGRGELRALTSGAAPVGRRPGGSSHRRAPQVAQQSSSVYVMSTNGCCVRRLGPCGSAPEWVRRPPHRLRGQ